MSFSSIEDATQSFADEFLDPRAANRRNNADDHEMTHWHSSPIAFAVLPAVAGLLFQNGSAFVTDILLLVIAAIFMNWSIRLPWDWYYSAQALRRHVQPEYEDADQGDETAVETASSAGSSPKPTEDRKRTSDVGESVYNLAKKEKAAADLRQQELLALAGTFILPILAAYLLHIIRAQLSGPSNGLVSDYNLSIFLLAAEIRPIRQVIRLVATRTLYLQRTVSGIDDPFASVLDEKGTIAHLTERIMDLEAKLSEHALVPPTMDMAQKNDISELSTEIRKRYEPRVEGLERAVRRYEKRSATLAMVTEQRLASLETRLQEVTSLAAVAAQSSQRKGTVATLLEALSRIIVLPLQIAWSVLIWPVVALEQLYNRIKSILLGPVPPRSPKRKGSRQEGRGRDDSRSHEKPARKLIR